MPHNIPKAQSRFYKNSKFILEIAVLFMFGRLIAQPCTDLYTRLTAVKQTALTPGETVLVKAVFGDDFDTSNIYKSYRRDVGNCSDLGFACVDSGGSTIKFVEPQIFIDDYSLDGSQHGNYLFTFMHETTHIWQGRIKNHALQKCTTYLLSRHDVLDTTKTFDHYCSEFQGQLIGNYATYFLRPDISATDAIFVDRIRDIVETKFPKAALVRVRMQRQAQEYALCFNKAVTLSSQNICKTRYYTNVQSQPLVTELNDMTFTLPNGKTTYPLREARLRLAKKTYTQNQTL